MTPDREQKLPWPRRRALRIAGEAAVVATGILLCSCSLPNLNPFSSAPTPQVPAPLPTSPIPSVGSIGDTLWQFGWLSILLLLFFPQIRGPIVGLWTAIFNTLAVPFLAARAWYDGKSSKK